MIASMYLIEITGNDITEALTRGITLAKTMNVDSLKITIKVREDYDSPIMEIPVWAHKDSTFLDLDRIFRLEYKLALLESKDNNNIENNEND
jgi:hypothetical protein